MENKQTVFRKVSVKDRLPKNYSDYFTNVGKVHFRGRFYYWVEWWLEEIELPSDEDVKRESVKYYGNL